ncbi:ATP-dependent 6-phosphofructokinase 2 [termite gut metagenome]|uniref:6-phosphofructokinase n=1 Tax=termite gut metagenome TaxID=433724 RepID=A0A5J4SLM6_9ZZZZ
MKIGILSSGGDCPGINAAIRGVGKVALSHYGMEVIGIQSGFLGLLENNYIPLTEASLSGLLSLGGTILGTSREKPFKKLLNGETDQKPQIILDHYNDLGLDCLVCIGGNGTQKTAHKLAQLGLHVIGIPKTIDNDVWGTDRTFGFYTAVDIATEAIDRLHSTANSLKRVMVIELMGHKAGWITLYAGMAGGADVILLPELGYNINKVTEAILNRAAKGKPYSIVAVGEGLKIDDKRIEKITGIETRKTILGYVQRGGSPSAYDRNLATRLSGHAIELIAEKHFGRMVSLQDGHITSIPLKEVAGKLKLVPSDHDLIIQGKRMGISFGI